MPNNPYIEDNAEEVSELYSESQLSRVRNSSAVSSTSNKNFNLPEHLKTAPTG